MSKFVRYAFVALLAAAFAVVPASAEVVTLKAHEGYDFIKKSVTKKGETNNDLSFAVAGKKGAISAKKVKGLGQGLPDARAFLSVQSWPTSVEDPTPGYFAVQGRDGKSIYLVQLNSFSNYGKPSNWEMSFSWERLQ